MRPDLPTKTPQTQGFYLRVVTRLERHAAKMLAAGGMADIADRNIRIAIAYADLEPTITADTARLYRAAVRHAMSVEPGDRDHDVLRIIDPEPSATESDRQDWLKRQRAIHLIAPRGAQQKARWLAPDDWARLGTALRQSRSMWATAARQWIAATLLTGLRPSEWKSAKVIERALVVQNAKSTNGRSHSPTRTIGLAKLDRRELDLITSFVDLVRFAGEDGYKPLYNGVRDLIRELARTTFKGRAKYPSLYTARHCFAARAKATYNKEGVAALMGHASTATAGRCYAHSRHAKGGHPLEVEPAAGDIDAVRRAQAAKQLLGRPKDAA